MYSFRTYKSRRVDRDREGATAVELAVTFPVLLLLIMIVFEVSRMMMVQQCLAFAAEQGARRASLKTTVSETQVVDTTREAMQVAIPQNTTTVDVSVAPTMSMSMGSGTSLTVDAQVSLEDVSWVSGNLVHHFGNPTLKANAAQERE